MLGETELKLEITMILRMLKFHFLRKSDEFLVMVLLELLILKCLAASLFTENVLFNKKYVCPPWRADAFKVMLI